MVTRTAHLDYRQTGAEAVTSRVVSLAEALEKQKRRAQEAGPALRMAGQHAQYLGSVSQSANAKIASLTNTLGPLGAGLGAVSRAAPAAAQSIVKLAAATERASVLSRALNTTILGGVGVTTAAGVAAIAYADNVIRGADAYSAMTSRIRVFSESNFQAAQSERELFKSAKDARTSVEALTTLYTRIAPAVRDYGKAQEDALKVTELASKALLIQGATIRETEASTIQFAQALASGVLRGDELRSLLESSPQLLRYISQNLEINGKVGVAFSQLRNLGEKGVLTTDKLMTALLAASPQIEADFVRAPKTAQQAWQVLSDTLTRTVGQLAQSSGAQQAVFDWIAGLSDRIDDFRQKLILDPSGLDPVKESIDFVADAATMLGQAASFAADNWETVVTVGQALIALKLGEVFAGWTVRALEASRAMGASLGSIQKNARFAAGATLEPAAAAAATSLRQAEAGAAIRAAELQAQADLKAAQAAAARKVAEDAAAKATGIRAREAQLRAEADGVMQATRSRETVEAVANERKRALAVAERAALEEEALRRATAARKSYDAAAAASALSSAGVGPAGSHYAKLAGKDAVDAKRMSDADLQSRISRLRQIEAAEHSVAATTVASAGRRAAAETAAARAIASADALAAQGAEAEAVATRHAAAATRLKDQADKAAVAATSAKAAASDRAAVAAAAEAAVAGRASAAQAAQAAVTKVAAGAYNLLGGAVGIATIALGALAFAIYKAREAYKEKIQAQREALVISDQLRAINDALTAATWAEIPALQAKAQALREQATAARLAAEAERDRLAAERQRALENAQGFNQMGLPEASVGARMHADMAGAREADVQRNLEAARNDEWKRTQEEFRTGMIVLTQEASRLQRQLAAGKDDAGRPLSAADREAANTRLGELFRQGQGQVDRLQGLLERQQAAVAGATGEKKNELMRGQTVFARSFDAAAGLVSAADTAPRGSPPPARPDSDKLSSAERAVMTVLSRLAEEAVVQSYLPKSQGGDRFSVAGGKIQDATAGGVFAARSEDEAKAAQAYLEQMAAIDKASDKLIAKAGVSRDALRRTAEAKFEYAVKTSQASQADERLADLMAEIEGESRAVVKAEREIADLRERGATVTDEAAKAYVAYAAAQERARRSQQALSAVEPHVREATDFVMAGRRRPEDANGVLDAEAAARQIADIRAEVMLEAERRVRAELAQLAEAGAWTEQRLAKETAERVAAIRVAVDAQALKAVSDARAQAAADQAEYLEAQAARMADSLSGALEDLFLGGDTDDIAKRLTEDLLRTIYQELVSNPLRKLIKDLLNDTMQPSQGGPGDWLSQAVAVVGNVFSFGGGGSGGGGGGSGFSYPTTALASGGLFRGAGGPRDDANLVRLSDKEFVVNAEATRKNLATLYAINEGAVVHPLPAFADGGLVGGGGFSPAARQSLDAGRYAPPAGPSGPAKVELHNYGPPLRAEVERNERGDMTLAVYPLLQEGVKQMAKDGSMHDAMRHAPPRFTRRG